jgi:hypothetical protein
MALELEDIFSGVLGTGAAVVGGQEAQEVARRAEQREDVHRGQVAQQLRLGISGPQGTTRSTNRGQTQTLTSPAQRQFNLAQDLQTGAGKVGAGLYEQGGRIDPFSTTLPGPRGGGPGFSLDTARGIVQGDDARRQVALQDTINDAVTKEIQRVGPPGRSTNFGSPSGQLGTTLQRLANTNLMGQEQEALDLYGTMQDRAIANTLGQVGLPGQQALAANQAFDFPDMTDVTQGAQVMSALRPTSAMVPDQTLSQLLAGAGDVIGRSQARDRTADDPLRNALISALTGGGTGGRSLDLARSMMGLGGGTDFGFGGGDPPW